MSIDGQQGHWSPQAKVRGIMPRAAWHWGSDSSIVNDPTGAPGSTPLYLCLPPIQGSAGGVTLNFHHGNQTLPDLWLHDIVAEGQIQHQQDGG
jgi:hypothetical protein